MKYRWLICVGGIEGVAAGLIAWAFFKIDDAGALLITIAAGVVVAAIVFALLGGGTRKRRVSGYLVVAVSIPFLSVLLGNSGYYGSVQLSLDPIALVVAAVWALSMLPVAMLVAMVDAIVTRIHC